jgi:hypothetical protein
MENQHTVLEQKRKLNLGKEQSNYACKERYDAKATCY